MKLIKPTTPIVPHYCKNLGNQKTYKQPHPKNDRIPSLKRQVSRKSPPYKKHATNAFHVMEYTTDGALMMTRGKSMRNTFHTVHML